MKNLSEFLAAYGELHDAVLKEITVSYVPDSPYPKIYLAMECMNRTLDEAWVHLQMTFLAVQEFRIVSEAQYSIDVIFEFTAEAWNGKLLFNFSPKTVPLTGIAYHRASDFYLVCDEFDFQERLLEDSAQ